MRTATEASIMELHDLKKENIELKRKIKKIVGYLRHDGNCQRYLNRFKKNAPPGECTCGLDELKKSLEDISE